MATTEALKELKQLRAITGKILKHLEDKPKHKTRWWEHDQPDLGPGRADSVAARYHRQLLTAKNVTRLVDAAIRHLDAGHIGLTRALLILLDAQEGVRR